MDQRVLLLSAGAGLMAVAGILAVPASIYKWKPLWRRASRWPAIAGLLACASAAAIEWWGLGRAPARSMSESLLLLAPALALGYLLIEWLSKSREGGLPILLAASATAFLAAAIRASAGPLLRDPTPPELDSPWLNAYVVTAFLALGLLGAAGLQAGAFLLVERLSPSRAERAGRGAFWLACLGLPLLVWHLFAAALWAQGTTGHIWSWSAREIWTLVLALVLTAYLCLRHVGHWPERRTAWLLAASILTWAVALAQVPVAT